MIASSGKRTTSAPAAFASASPERIRSRFPSRSPTVVSIWASARRMRFSTQSLKHSLPAVDELVIDPRFNGPAGSANGGYTCGLVADFVDGVAEVTLRRPPPLGRPLVVERDGDRVRRARRRRRRGRSRSDRARAGGSSIADFGGRRLARPPVTRASRSMRFRPASSAAPIERPATGFGSSQGRLLTGSSPVPGHRPKSTGTSSGRRSTVRAPSPSGSRTGERRFSGGSQSGSTSCPRSANVASCSGGRSARTVASSMRGRRSTARTAVRSPAPARPGSFRLERVWRNTDCVAGPRCSPRCRVLSRAHSYGYGRSLRPCLGTTIAPLRRAVLRQTL